MNEFEKAAKRLELTWHKPRLSWDHTIETYVSHKPYYWHEVLIDTISIIAIAATIAKIINL